MQSNLKDLNSDDKQTGCYKTMAEKGSLDNLFVLLEYSGEMLNLSALLKFGS